MKQVIKVENLNRTFTEKKGGMIKFITGKRKIVTNDDRPGLPYVRQYKRSRL